MGDKLVVMAEHAHAFRRIDVLDQVSQILQRLPLPRRYAPVGRYYQALCIHDFGRGDVEEAARLVEHVVEDVSPRYKAKAMLSLGSMFVRMGNNQSAMSLFLEALRANANEREDLLTTITTLRTMAVLRSMDGDHRGALTDLEGIFPAVRTVGSWYPHLKYDYLNSLAVELCEVGRLEEARNALQIVLASPFAAAYPEWRETREEIELRGWCASRSTVAQIHAGAVSRRVGRLGNLAGQREVVGGAALVTPEPVSKARTQPHDGHPVDNGGTPTTNEVSESSNILTLPRRTRSFSAAELSTGSQALARVIAFPSRTPSMSDENDEELDANQKRRFIADRLYGMFMDTLEGKDVDLELVEKLWKVYIETRKNR